MTVVPHQMMNSDEVVPEFIDRLAICVAALHIDFASADRAEPGSPLQLTLVGTSSRVRHGRLEGVGEFHLHGAGCVVEFFDGAVVDFDWDAQGREIFDVWRLGRFAESVAKESPSDSALLRSAQHAPMLFETQPGWFALRLSGDAP